VYEINPILDERWTRFLDTHLDSSIFHSAEWFKVLRDSYGYQPLAFVDAPPGREIHSGHPFCVVDSWLTGKRLVSVPFSDHTAMLTNEDASESLIEALSLRVQQREFQYLEIRPVGEAGSITDRLGKTAEFYHHKISLSEGLSSIYGRLHKDCVRRKIRRAEREQLGYAEGRDELVVKQFYDLLLLTHDRHRSPSQPISWFKHMASSLGEAVKFRIALKDERPIAGLVTLCHKNTMTFKYGCSDAHYHRMGAVAFLMWKSIQDAAEAGMTEFDMGRSDPRQQGLITFKEHWGAERSKLSYWRYPSNSATGLRAREHRWIQSVMSVAPKVARRTAGRLLYRHMG